MGHYKKYSGGNHHLRMDMDHERRLIHDAKDAIWDEDRKLRDRKSAAHEDGVDVDTQDVDAVKGARAVREIGGVVPEDKRATEEVK